MLVRAVPQEKLMENGGTEGAPRRDGPSLKTGLICIYTMLQGRCLNLIGFWFLKQKHIEKFTSTDFRSNWARFALHLATVYGILYPAYGIQYLLNLVWLHVFSSCPQWSSIVR